MELIKTKSFELATISKGDKDAEKVVICLPGRLDTKDYANFVSHIDYLSQKGYFALSFDPPYTWESPGDINNFTTTNYIKATHELIEYLGNRPTILLGHSRGGATASLVGTDNPHVIAIIGINESFGTPSPPRKEKVEGGIYRDHRDLPPGGERTKEQKLFEMGLGYFEDGAKYNDAEKLKSCTKPKLIIRSKEDRFNTLEEVREVFDSLPEPKELHEVVGTHDYRLYPDVIAEVNELIGKFIEKYGV